MARVLFIITQSEIGGAQRYLLELAPYLLSRGHEVLIAAGEGDDELFNRLKIKDLRFKIYKIKSLVRTLNPLKDILALVKILKIIKKENPNVLFLQSTKAGFLGSLAAKLHNIHVIYRIGGWSFNDPRPWWMNKIIFWMEKISAQWKDVIIVNSEFDRQIAIDKKIAPAEKIVRIYNGLDNNRLKFLEKEEARRSIEYRVWSMEGEASAPLYSIPHTRPSILVGTIANLYATKGIEYLIEAAHLLPSIPHTPPPILFVVIGEGKERPKLEALIKKYNLESKFFLLGRIPNAAQYLKAFDIFVLPSVKEGFPWVLLEAMAAEVPIVATRVGAVPEIIEDGKGGLLVPPKDPRALAEKIQQLIASPDPILPKNASEKLKQFSLQKMLEESQKLIRNL